jgi:hypothetical protein
VTVNVEGTPASPSATDPVTYTFIDENDDQVAARAAVEGGSGRYDEVVDLTHPNSNDAADLQLLAQSYARLTLRVNATIRRTVKCRVRGKGSVLRPGMIATVTLAPLQIVSSSWIIQRAHAQDEDGKDLIYELELTEGNVDNRAYRAWLGIVKKGLVTVIPPDLAYTNSVIFTSGGTWTVPAGITTAEFICVGSGGGGGGAVHPTTTRFDWGQYQADGGFGGAGGKGISILDVTPAEDLTITVGSGGAAGANGSVTFNTSYVITDYSAASAGGTGTITKVARGGTILLSADGGGGGQPGTVADGGYGYAGANGYAGSASAQIPISGAGRAGGYQGWTQIQVNTQMMSSAQPQAGQAGYVEIRW